jgi:hypothetical protein
MDLVNLLLLLVGFICFCIATASAPARFNLVALGLALWILVPLIHQAHGLN